jgi:hypothetical protein
VNRNVRPFNRSSLIWPVAMLPLNDPRWNELTTFFEDPAYLTKHLAEWVDAIGFDQERDIYLNYLFNLYLHQGTITNAAFAVVPYLVSVCEEGRSSFSVEYLTDVAYIEANRLTHGLYYNRPNTVEFPDWLMGDYRLAIAKSPNLVDDAIDNCNNADRKHELVAMKPAFFGNGKLAWAQR